MPVFRIGLDDGRTLKIDADTQEAALAGAQHFMENNKPDTGMVSALGRGAANMVRGLGDTASVVSGSDVPERMASDGANKFDNPNYSPANPMQNGVGDIPRGIAESFPGAALPIGAGALASRVKMFKGVSGGKKALLGALLGSAAELYGSNVKDRAAAMEHPAPTLEDKMMGGATTAAQAAIGTVGASRFLPGLSQGVSSVGLKGVLDSAKKLAVTTATEAAAAGGQNVAGQVGNSIGTPGGLQVDPEQAGNAAVIGGATGAALGTGPSIADANNAVKYRNFGGVHAPAATAVANRLQASTDGNLANVNEGYSALESTRGDIRRELRDAANETKGRSTLAPEVSNTLARASEGGKVTDKELSQLTSAVQGDPQAENILHLVRQAQVADRLSTMGSNVDGRFVGGMSGAMEKGIPMIRKPLPAIAAAGMSLAGLHGLPGFIGMYAPAAVGGIGAAYGGARMLDKLTGARSPANRFAQKFANPNAPVRMTPPAPPAAPVPPTPIDPRLQQEQIKDAMALMSARRANAKLAETQRAARGASEADSLASGSDALADVPMGTIQNPGFGKRASQLLGAAKSYRRLTAEEEEAAQGPQGPASPGPQTPPAVSAAPPPMPTEPPQPGPPTMADHLWSQPHGSFEDLMKAARAMKSGLSGSQGPVEPPGLAGAPGLPTMPQGTPMSPVPPQASLGLSAAPGVVPGGIAARALAVSKITKKNGSIKVEHAPAAGSGLPAPAPSPGVVPGAPEVVGNPLEQAMETVKPKRAPKAAPAPGSPEEALVVLKKHIAATAKQEKAKAAKAAKVADAADVLRSASPDVGAEAPKAARYKPLTEAERWGSKMSDEEFADADMKRKKDKGDAIRNPGAYKAMIVKARTTRRNMLAELSGDWSMADQDTGSRLLDELNHARGVQAAKSAIKHFTAKLSASARKEARAKLDDTFVEGMWKER